MKHSVSCRHLTAYQDNKSITAILWLTQPAYSIHTTVCYQRCMNLQGTETSRVKVYANTNSHTCADKMEADTSSTCMSTCPGSDTGTATVHTIIVIWECIDAHGHDSHTVGLRELANLTIPEKVNVRDITCDVSEENIVLDIRKRCCNQLDSVVVGLNGNVEKVDN
ncbi:hypothetical protein SARC_10298 [Sphaeroforma arctica JP610]|uniref:Uncharacterized protein n=1 Tax=Sphaeroforma arctica JP610 TaxID=667725 RepID=A0A0L0FL88_9EUKA|nr:hypothetical protein SARC_10298 [Sphaeroforma arctica JP610]KNC77236.1 hypothetical protein SARC_10298 [Sphaeroforma arctica JP610]|eukprot:XP_014151138.1 hypothetical protein SARC_10298 [Sphaeroforma arctica JP610]